MLPLQADDPRVIGEFRLHARLGAGGMGRVYLASSPGGRAVAVKVIHPHLACDPAFAGRFRREVAAALAVNGGYAAPVVAAGAGDDPPWLATAFVPGPSLQETVTATGPLTEDAVVKLAAGLAEALRAIHDCGLVHRDLKPGNVLLAADGPRVIDFGIAKAVDGTVLTSAGNVLGTPSYMSPEQAQAKPTGPASDVFSLGCVLYFAGTGMNPFGTGHPAVLLYRIVHTDPDMERLAPQLRDLVMACLVKDPERRPAPADLAAGLADAAPPGHSPAAFWPGPVARLIRDYEARIGVSPKTPETPGAPASPGAPGTPVTPTGQAVVTPTAPVMAGARAAATRADPGGARPVPHMGRRRAMATLAGMATGGLAVAGWEFARPGRAAGHAAARSAAKPLPPPGTKVWISPTNGPVPRVAVAGGVVYAGTNDNTVFAFNAATGKQIWRRATTNGFNDQLVAAGGTLFVADGSDGGVFALDGATGRQLWRVASSGVLGLAVAGQVVYTGIALKSSTTGGVTALSAGSGELLWTAEFTASIDTNGGLAVAGGAVYATTADGEIYAFSAARGRTLWRFAGRNVQFGAPPPVAAGGVLYACDGNKVPALHAVSSATGRGLWKQSLGASQYPAYLAVSGGVVFAGMTRNSQSSGLDGGDLSALNAASGRLLWKVRVAGGVYLETAGPDSVVYSGSNNGALDAWHANTGNRLWSYQAADGIGSNIAVAGGVAYFGAGNRVYAVAAQR